MLSWMRNGHNKTESYRKLTHFWLSLTPFCGVLRRGCVATIFGPLLTPSSDCKITAMVQSTVRGRYMQWTLY